MYSTTQDFINKQVKHNDFLDGRDQIIMKDFNFLPSIQLDYMDYSVSNEVTKDIINDQQHINVEELSKYVTFVLNLQTRRPEGLENVIVPFR